TDREVVIDEVTIGEGCSIIRIRVVPDERRQPYALLKDGGRHFQIRIADRIRNMNRDELFRPHAGRSSAEEQTRLDLLKRRTEFITSRQKGLWLCIQPVPALTLELSLNELRPLLQ